MRGRGARLRRLAHGSIGKEFEGRRWGLPAKLYAAPLELYAGRALAADDLVGERKR